jgi:hypothetical protein
VRNSGRVIIFREIWIMWSPISIENLKNLVLKGELKLKDSQLNFWDLIKIEPEKWKEKEYGEEGGGFWVVAVFGREVIWYNDIEEGFNISSYKTYGEIEEYWCNQSDLNQSVIGLMERLKANRF